MPTSDNVVVLKLSGAAMTGKILPWEGEAYEAVGDQIAEIVAGGTRCGVVIGGGNFIRAGMMWGARGMYASPIDQLGMMGSGWNAQALAFQLTQIGGLKPRVISSADVAAGFAERWDADVLGNTVEEVLIVAGGIGQEGVSTDIAAPLLAMDMGAKRIVMSKNGVDGLYDGDPNADHGPGAEPQLLQCITATGALSQNLKIMDRKALELCRDNGIVVQIVGADRLKHPRSISRAIGGEQLGSIILPS